jgi:hypothetical protein
MDGKQPEGTSHWRTWKVVILLLVGLIVVDVAVRAHRSLWFRFDPHPYRDHLEGCRRQRWDMLIVGGSPTGYAIDPAILAGARWHGQPLRDIYNFGLPLATAAEVFESARHGLTAPPRLLLYGVCVSDFNEDRRVPEGPQYLMNSADLVRWIGHRPGAGLWGLKQFALQRLGDVWQLFANRRGIRLWAEQCFAEACPGLAGECDADASANYCAWRYGNGYIAPANAPFRALLPEQGADGLGCFLEKYRLGAYFTYLDDLAAWTAARGIPLVLVDMPVHASLETHYPQVFERYRARLAETERAMGLPVLRPTRAALGLDDSCFGDPYHLNAKGSRRLSEWIRQALEGL